MDAGLGLPKRFFITLLSVVALTMMLLFICKNKADQLMIICLSLLLFFSAMHGALLIRMGNFEVYKNSLNAIWNIYTACAFIYGIYIIINYSATGLNNPEDIIKMVTTKTFPMMSIIISLGAVCIVRAGYSVAEIFKVQIIQSRKKRAEYQQSTTAE